MQMLLTIVDESKKEELEVFFERSGVEGYSEISPVAGLGVSGPRHGSRAFPRASAMILTILDEESLARLTAGIDEFCETCGEKLRMVSWPIEVLR